MKMIGRILVFVIGVGALMEMEFPWSMIIAGIAALILAPWYYDLKRRAFRHGYDPKGTASEEEVARAEKIAGWLGHSTSLKDDVKRIIDFGQK